MNVSEFDINNLSKAAFGGFEEKQFSKKKEKFPILKSAYLLFYEKVDKENCIQFDNIYAINQKISIENKNEIEKEIQQSLFKSYLQNILFTDSYHHFCIELIINILNCSFPNKKDNENVFKNYFNVQCKNLAQIEKEKYEILNKNENENLCNISNLINKKKLFLFKHSIEESDFFNNLNINSNEKEKKNNRIELFKFIISLFYNVMMRCKEKKYLGAMIDLIKYFINSYLECAEFLIEEFSEKTIINEFLINCPLYENKKIFVGLIYCAMIKICNEFHVDPNEIQKLKNKKKVKKKRKKIVMI